MHKIWIVVAAIALWAVEAQAETRKTRNNRQAAEAWCAAKKAEGVDCKVAKTSGCGVGWTKAKRFREGGNAYYACERNRYGNASEQNKAECTAWCAENPSRGKACTRPAGGRNGDKQEKKRGTRKQRPATAQEEESEPGTAQAPTMTVAQHAYTS